MWRNYEKNTQVANVDADMQPLIRSLFNAILCVKDKYLYWTTENKERFAYVERSFAYELYFRWKIDESVFGNPLWEHVDKLCINAEITKQFDKAICDNKDWGYPDMVLHGGNNSSCNYIVCEIKRKENVDSKKNSLTEDINKLAFFLRDDLHIKHGNVNWTGYRYGVFILTGQYHKGGNMEVKPEDVISHLILKNMDVPDNLKTRIICVVYNGKDIKYDNLLDILKLNNK